MFDLLYFCWHQMFDFAFVVLSLCLDLLHHVQRCRFRPVITQIETKNELKSTTTNASIIDGAIFCPYFFIAWNLSSLARKRLLILQKTSDCLVKSYLIFADRLLDLQVLDEIKFYVIFFLQSLYSWHVVLNKEVLVSFLMESHLH